MFMTVSDYLFNRNSKNLIGSNFLEVLFNSSILQELREKTQSK